MIQIESGIPVAPRAPHAKAWSDEELRIARQMVESGSTARAIAAAIGRTRNSVIGAANRGLFKLRPVGKPAVYPLREMNIGDSFFTENILSVRRRAAFVQDNFNMRFCTRREGTGVRVWRIA